MNSTVTEKLAATGLAAAQGSLAALLTRRAKSQAAANDYDRRLREVQAKERFGDAWLAPAEAEDDGVEIRIDSPTTINYASPPASAPAVQSAVQTPPAASALGTLGKLALGAALVASGGGAGVGATYLAGLFSKPAAVAAPAPQATPSLLYSLELVPEENSP